ncbi:unnamed protein product [Adineta ricciae]|uniref:EGF-like domain-containing protein n=1 Tax=Adineta ricciae TaxID=249248 RepID=A0A815NHH8_ADIRI|nr:unnamed protein product [Adineta ricciae]
MVLIYYVICLVNILIIIETTKETSSFSHEPLSIRKQLPSVVVSSNCTDPTKIGPYCNISNIYCDMAQPCKNNGTCHSLQTSGNEYNCSCPIGFTGIDCSSDDRLCKPDTCLNKDICVVTTNRTFNCTCVPGWEGRHCETKINYCLNIKCQNRGVCRSEVLDYKCECLHRYSGRLCQIKNQSLSIKSSWIISTGVTLFLLISFVLL